MSDVIFSFQWPLVAAERTEERKLEEQFLEAAREGDMATLVQQVSLLLNSGSFDMRSLQVSICNDRALRYRVRQGGCASYLGISCGVIVLHSSLEHKIAGASGNWWKAVLGPH